MDPIVRRPDPVEMVIEEKELVADVKREEQMIEFPETNLNLDSVKGFREKKKELKYMKLKAEAIKELKNSLKIFHPDELKLNHSVVLFCCQIVEDLFTSKAKGHIKKDVVIEVCKEYFHEKEEVVEMVIDLVFDKIVKTSFLRRNKNKIKSVGFFLLDKLSPDLSNFSASKLKAL
jgi:hypothetical protein